MQPLSDWHPPRGLIGVFTDIDDTLTTEGAITPDALQALADLKAAGLHVVPITGRPVGWSEPFSARWPVDAIVAENGAVALQHQHGQALIKLYQQDASTRSSNFARMQQVLAQIERSIPGAMRSQDSAGRETDIAIDHSEFTQLPQHAIDAATIAGAQYLANHDQDYDGASRRIKEIMRQDLGLDAATAWNNCEDPNPLAQIASIDTAISNECISFKRTQAQPTDQPTNDIRVVLPDLTMPTIFGGITGNDHLDLSAIAASNGNNCADPFDPTCGGAGGSTTTGPTTTAGPTTTLSEADFCHWTDVWWLLMTDEGWTRCGVYHPEINITT